jgi:DNA-binding NtrC family response regulator
VEHFLQRIRRETGKQIDGVTGEALDVLLGHPWPGNIRQLINSLQFAAVRCTTDRIALDHLPPELRRHAGPETPFPAGPAHTPSVPPRRRRLTPESVAEALGATGGNKVQAARLLGVGRATLYRFLKKDDS